MVIARSSESGSQRVFVFVCVCVYTQKHSHRTPGASKHNQDMTGDTQSLKPATAPPPPFVIRDCMFLEQFEMWCVMHTSNQPIQSSGPNVVAFLQFSKRMFSPQVGHNLVLPSSPLSPSSTETPSSLQSFSGMFKHQAV